YLLSDDCGDSAESFKVIYGPWLKGDKEALSKVFSEMENRSLASKQILQILNNSRNKVFFKQIERYINSGKKVFVVVGAAHLVGEDGLLKSFEKNGYKIEQVKRKR
ncbi:MAG: TraB/GumN family protein, partial [Lentisphaeria bacterium]